MLRKNVSQPVLPTGYTEELNLQAGCLFTCHMTLRASVLGCLLEVAASGPTDDTSLRDSPFCQPSILPLGFPPLVRTVEVVEF